MKILYVGDPHAKVNDLEEMVALQKFVKETAVSQNVDRIVVLGDQFHNHQQVHTDVMKFWRECLLDWTYPDHGFDVYLIVGNHDKKVGVDITDAHSLLPYVGMERVTVVDRPRTEGGILYLPYYADVAQFLEAAKGDGKPTNTLVCHQTFDGAMYENGFYAPDGIDSNLVPQKNIISGHIHLSSEFGKVFYPGSPRWMTLSDKNTDKAIWVMGFDSQGSLLSKTPFSTADVCMPIFVLEDTPETPAVIPERGNITVNVRGPADFVRVREAELRTRGITKVRPFPDREKKIVVRESDGIPVAFSKFVSQFKPKGGSSSEELLALAKMRVSWMRA